MHGGRVHAYELLILVVGSELTERRTYMATGDQLSR